jgi:hypothetical protein
MSPTDDCTVDEANVIYVALDASGDADRALDWFRNTPLSCFDGRTAYQLVRDGRTEDVLRYLASLEAAWVG